MSEAKSGVGRSSDDGSTTDGIVLSDASPDPIRPGAQYAQTRIEIDPSALTGRSQIDETTRALAEKLASVADRIPKGFGPLYGTLVHGEFKADLLLGGVPGVTAGDIEPTFGGTGRYGSRDSVRPDVVLRNEIGDIMAIYDVKTGTAEIKPWRAEELRAAVGVGRSVPVIELHLRHGVSLKYLHVTNLAI